MRSFVISLVLLLLVVVLTAANALAMDHITDTLLDYLEKDEITEAQSYWRGHYKFMSLSTHLRPLEEADKDMEDMCVYYEEGQTEDFEAARQRFKLALDALETGEKFTFYNIF